MEDHPSRALQLQERHYEILYRTSPAWLVPDGRGLPYPGDWAGRIVSVRPAGHSWGPGDLADPRRGVIRLELTDEEARACRRGEVRFAGVSDSDGGSLVAVGFDERWGALAAGLRQRFGSEAERLEAEAKAEADAPPGEAPPRDHEFNVAVRELKAALPRMVTHSGAGLYEVGPGKTYSTIQSALDQLWTDQGAATFTASQYIRVYAGTYAENVVPSAGLAPDMTGGYLLVLEGDPADDRDNIKIDPASGHGVNVACDQIRVRHLWIDTVGSSYCVYSSVACAMTEVLDCKLTVVNSTAALRPEFGAHIENCEITVSGNGRGIFSGFSGYTVKSCKITGPGKATSTLQAIVGDIRFTPSPTIIEGTVISGFATGVLIVDNLANGVRLLNTTFHDCTVGIRSQKATCSPQEVVNCIFKDCTYNYQVLAWPEETSTRTGPAFVQRNNCYHGYTNFAHDGSTTKTYAQWIAYELVDADGELDATDPLLTDAASGDFSLQAASPCRHAGIGAGVLSDYLGDAFDAVRPDIGAASTGTVETPSRPSAEVAAVDGDTITVSIEGDADAEHRAELVRARTGEIVDSESRDGGGQVSLTAPELCARYFVVASSANAAGRSLPSLPCEVFVPEGAGPLEEVRMGIVSRLAAHVGLAELLGTDETGAVPVYAAGPERPKRLPCVVYTLSGVPDGELDRPGRWLVTLALDAWGGSAGVNDRVVGALDEILHRLPFGTTSWAVKRIRRTGGGTRWADDGRTEIRYTTWSLVVDRCVT